MKKTLSFVPWLLAVAFVGCAGRNPVPVLTASQGSHDLLALAQDEEVQLCLGVPNVAAAMTLPVVNHCTTPVAQTIRLTDARHQAFQRQMAQAWALHIKGVRLAQAGTSANSSDQTVLQAAIDAILVVLGELEVTPTVTQLISNVKAGVQ